MLTKNNKNFGQLNRFFFIKEFYAPHSLIYTLFSTFSMQINNGTLLSALTLN